ncbi:MAG TPA: hypothetical protein DEB24_01590, partial [Coriobacteriia bacterium]|nr:hypothetical protein [Coriobacteriia bacterium]
MARREIRSHGAGAVHKQDAGDVQAGVDVEALADIQAYSDLRERRKKAKRKKVLILSVVGVVSLLVVIGGIFWLLSSMTAPKKDAATMQNVYVERGNFLDTVSASGVLAPISSVSATPEVDGLVGEVFIAEGDTVTAGQKLYTIINADLDKLVTQAKQGIGEANNGIAQAQIALDDAYRAKRQGIAAEAEARAAAAEA